jgi:phosphatidylglycerophosphate synthase
VDWANFIKEAIKTNEAKNGFVWNLNRRIGLRLAYVFYHLGFNANLVSSMRVLIAVFALWGMSQIINGSAWWPVFGALLMILEVNLDFADGPLARVNGKSTELGNMMDGLGNSVSRAGMIVMLGYFTGSVALLIISVVSGFILSAFWDSTSQMVFKERNSSGIYKLFRLSSSVVFVLVVLPVGIAAYNLSGLPLKELAYTATCIYGFLAVFWLFVCLTYRREKMDNTRQ